jgi:hypothetical protein
MTRAALLNPRRFGTVHGSGLDCTSPLASRGVRVAPEGPPGSESPYSNR